jgi:serine/threonine protein kinase
VTYQAELCSADGKHAQTTSVFCKIIPLTDPYKFLTGKTFHDNDIFNLPTYTDARESSPCLVDVNNNAYVDGMFTQFTSLLQNQTTFVHGVPYYGAFMGVKRNLAVNIYDDLEYLHGSSFFNTHKNVDFQVEDYSLFINDILETGTARSGRMPPISIAPLVESSETTGMDTNVEHAASDIGEVSYDGLFEVSEDVAPTTVLSLADLAATDLEVIGIGDTVPIIDGDDDIVIDDNDDSSSSCSSRTSCTSDGDGEKSESGTSDEWSDESGSDDDEPIVLATLPRFPVEVVFMEKMDYTLDALMSRDELSDDHWFSIFMQVIMTLLTYQRVFSFTHNDLHSSNIMFTETKKAFLFYKFGNSYYKVPTFGRIAKIIDFGRSIYTYNDMVICSDSFKPGADASTQYNTEPYYNTDKPRIDPNFSFDLCRLACSIYDDIEDEMESEPDNRVMGIIKEWCMDDTGRNVLYKSNGDERYPSFKLYKMIARHVHRHTPEAQLHRPEFSRYVVKKKDIASKYMGHVMDIDKFPVLKTRFEPTDTDDLSI